MANLPTSYKTKFTGDYRRYEVTYEDEVSMMSCTFGVTARSPSEATVLVTEFIDRHQMHKYDHPYFLIPRLANKKSKTTYNVI